MPVISGGGKQCLIQAVGKTGADSEADYEYPLDLYGKERESG